MNAVSHYMYTLRPTWLAMLSEGPTAEEAAIVEEHAAYLHDLTAQGIVILAGRTLTADEESFGIVILCAASPEAARNLMDNDPAVRYGGLQARLYPYRIAFMAQPT